MDKNLKVEEEVDKRQEKITLLERDIQRKVDEIEMRKEVQDSMGQSLMKYENDLRELGVKYN